MVSRFYPRYRRGAPHRQVEELLCSLTAQPGPPLSSLTPAQVRQANSIAQWVAPYEPAARTETRGIPGDHGEIPVRIYTPPGDGPFPILVYFHGGGFVFGDLDEADHVCATLSRKGACLVISVGYRLAPEHRFPAAVEDAVVAVRHLSRLAPEINGDLTRVAVAGESAGANLAAVVSQQARDGAIPEVPAIAYQLLLCPWVDLACLDTEAYGLFGDGPWLPRANIEYYREQYLGDLGLVSDARVSPLRAASFRSLPPAHIITAEIDVLRDEGEAYVARLLEAGVPATQKRYVGMIHSFFMLTGPFEAAHVALDQCGEKLREVFHT